MTTATIEIDNGGIEVLNKIIKLPRRPDWADTPEKRRQLDEEEAIIRDDLVAYGYAYGACDLEGLLEHFTDDVVLITPSVGAFIGTDMVRRNYRDYLFKDFPGARHHWGEVAVRFISPEEAYRTAIIIETHPKQLWWGVSTDVHHMKKVGGRWKIAKRRILMDGGFQMQPELDDGEDTRKKIYAEEMAKKKVAQAKT